uniref:Uncharacterized protein n=1 Tax=Kalanchoe fedtschenkoi TaxID=63787 RepID=A0A7N0TTJ0_KALFE
MSKLVVSNKALKLAEKWMDGMSKAPDYDTTALELEARPSRLGLGAKVPRKIEVGPLHDPVERKLNSKLNATKRKASQIAAENGRANAETNSDDDSDEDEPGGRSQAFSKKKAAPSNLSLGAKKK